MNRYERHAEQKRRAALRSSMTVWTAVLTLAAVVLVIMRLSGSGSPQFFSRAAIGLAIVLLVIRQLSRRLKGKGSRAAQPDPRSTLKLH
jgi:L-asparagine transporter-like permease